MNSIVAAMRLRSCCLIFPILPVKTGISSKRQDGCLLPDAQIQTVKNAKSWGEVV